MLAVAVLALMLLTAVPIQGASPQGPYTEKLSAYISGPNALWYFTFTGVNSSSKLSAVESSPGLSWYNITAIKTTSWASDFQVFGSKGYNLLPVPFLPSQGLFLTVGSDSYTDAAKAASALDSYLLTSFTSLSNGTATYSFYSPVSFDSLVSAIFFKVIPTTEHGFANAISPTWTSTPSPFIVLSGQQVSGGFSHTLKIGSISSSALDSSGRPAILTYFGSTSSQLQASSHSSSSMILVKSLDGIMKSTDKNATVTSDTSHFTGSYRLSLAGGKRVTRVNTTVVEQPPVLLATRSVTAGVLRAGTDIAVTLTMKNLSPSSTITKISFSDNWWNKTSGFKFLNGTYTVPTTSLAPRTSVTPVYRLEFTGTSTGSVMIPASVVRYQYSSGGSIFNATTILNPVQLSLGTDEPVVYAILIPNGDLGKSVGNPLKLNVTVTNVGALPASSVVVAGQTIPGLAAQSGGTPGGSYTVTVWQSAAGLLGINTTRSYAVTYQDPSGKQLNATTNVVTNAFSHATMNVGYPALSIGVQITALPQKTNLTLSFVTSNVGHANITTFAASEGLPAGLGCGKIVGKSVGTKGVTCTNGKLSINYPVVNASSALTAYMEYNITNAQNFLLPPAAFGGTSSGNGLAGMSNAVAVPTGLVISKQFSPSQLFPGMSSKVTVAASNRGPLELYNATLSTTPDTSVGTLPGSPNLATNKTNWSPGSNRSLTYSVTILQVSGSQKGTSPTASFFFAGTSFSIAGLAPTINVYQPLTVTITTTPPSPEEGKNFTINLQILNPSAVYVSNIHFILPIPSGLALSSLRGATVAAGVLNMSASSLGPGKTSNASARAVASSGITIPFDKSKLTFSYSGFTINGVVPKNSGIGINEDVTTRYLIPTGFVLLVVLLVAFYVRRKAGPTSPSSQK